MQVTYNTMLDAYSKWGRRSQARDLLKSMKQAGCTPDLWTYNILLDAAGKESSVSDAMQIFHELKAAGHSPNLVSFSALINMYGRLGDFEEAEIVWVEMRAAGCVPNATAYCGLMNSYSHHGMFKVLIHLLLGLLYDKGHFLMSNTSFVKTSLAKKITCFHPVRWKQALSTCLDIIEEKMVLSLLKYFRDALLFMLFISSCFWCPGGSQDIRGDAN